jgi:hypothetical protein
MAPQGEVSVDRPYQTSYVRSTAVPSLAYNPAEAKPFLSTPPSLSGEGPCLDISLTVEFSAENTKLGPILLTSILLPPGQSRNRPARTHSPFEFSAEKTWHSAAGATETRGVTLAGRQEISAEISQGGLNKIRDPLLTVPGSRSC